MGKSKYFLLIGLIFLIVLPSFGKVNRYMVFFKDKIGNSFDLEHPEDFLSERSIERREKQNIPVTMTDLPVSDYYINSLKEVGDIQVFFKSRWFNAILIEIEDTLYGKVLALPYVKRVDLVAPDSQLNSLILEGSGRKKGTHEIMDYDYDISSYVTQEQNQLIGVDVMHEHGYYGEGLMIGVFDSGFKSVDTSPYFSHLFDENKIFAARDFSKNTDNVFQYDTHGTKVLSCIGGFKENEFSGTAPHSDFVLCVTEDISSEYRIEEYNWLFAAEYADSLGVDIINSSVGYSYFDDETMDYTYEDLNGQVAVISRAAAMAASKGMIVVSSNGNEGNNSWKYLNPPADADSILSIGAVTYDLVRAKFSSFGPTSDGRIKPDLSALGAYTNVVSNDEVITANGTSFSAPLVAGLVAGFWQAYPSLSNLEVMEYLKISASQSDSPDTLIGYGIPNFAQAYRLAYDNEQDINRTFVIFPNPVTNERRISIVSDTLFSNQLTAHIDFFDLKGDHIHSSEQTIRDSLDLIEMDVSFLNPGIYILTCTVGKNIKKSKLIIP